MGLRRKSRELALQFLFGHDFQGQSCAPETIEEGLEMFCQVFEAGEKALPYCRELVLGLCRNQEAIDEQIKKHSHNWRLERMSFVDRNILRISVYEMQYCKDVPAQVAINEALEIAKRFSVSDSIGFINGILDSIKETLSDGE